MQTHFTDAVTHVPAHWANDVDHLVYEVFAGAQDIATIKGLFDLKSMAEQDFNAVQIIGGTIDGVPIGLSSPAPGRFTNVVLTLEPTAVNHSASKGYVDSAIAAVNNSLGTMATQDANTVNINGGIIDGVPIGINSRAPGAFTTLQVSSPPDDPSDVVTLAYLQSVVTGLPDVGTMGGQNALDVNILGGQINGTSIGNVTPLDGYFNALTAPFIQSAQARVVMNGSVTGFTSYAALIQAIGPANPNVGFQMGSTSGVTSIISSTGTVLVSVKNAGRMLFGAVTDDGASVLQTTGTISAGSYLIQSPVTLPLHATSKNYVDSALSNLAATVNDLEDVVTGLGTMSAQNSNNVAITGGAANNLVIGNITPNVGNFTNVYVEKVQNVLSGALLDFDTSTGYALQFSASLSTSPSMRFSAMSNGVIEFGAGAGNGIRVFGTNRVGIGGAPDDGTSALNVNGDVHFGGVLSMNAPALSGSGSASLGANCPATDPSAPFFWIRARVNGQLGWIPFFR